MASKLQMLQSKTCQANKYLSTNGASYYKQLLENNKKYIVDPSTVQKCQELSNQLFYTRLASIPGRTEAFWIELEGAKQALKNRKELRFKHAGIAALFGVELFVWFCLGETAGRGFTFTGYYP